MKYMLLLALIFGGCAEQTNWGKEPFIEMQARSIIIPEQVELCKNKPESIFCKTTEGRGDIQPNYDYTINVLLTMNSNFKYTTDNTWHYNDNIYKYLKGDCEDIASTMAKHMIEDGIATKYLSLVYRKTSETTAHMFLAVQTSDGGILHLDYRNSGYPIEPQINFHMKMNNVGINNWVKGNIIQEQ